MASDAEYMKAYREANKEYTKENNKRNKARQRALTRLANLYPQKFAELYREDLAKINSEERHHGKR